MLITSLHDRLGGHVMRWSRLKGQQWGGATLPIHHDGHYYNTEIKVWVGPSQVVIFDQSVKFNQQHKWLILQIMYCLKN